MCCAAAVSAELDVTDAEDQEGDERRAHAPKSSAAYLLSTMAP